MRATFNWPSLPREPVRMRTRNTEFLLEPTSLPASTVWSMTVEQSLSLNYDLKLHSHVRLGNDQELPPAFPEVVNELHVDIEDTPQSDMGAHFEKIFEFIGELITCVYISPLSLLHNMTSTHSLPH